MYLCGKPRIYQGVLFFKIVIQFRSARVNIISQKPIKQDLYWQNSQTFNSITRKSLTPNFNRIRHSMWKARTYVKCGFQWADLQDTHNNSINIYEPLNIILFQAKKKKTQNTWPKCCLRLSVMYGSNCIDFHETYNCSPSLRAISIPNVTQIGQEIRKVG